MRKKRTPKSPFPVIHGAYSLALVKKDTQYLWAVRRSLIHDLSPEGPEHLSTARHLIVERLMNQLATARMIEEYLAKNPDEILKAAPVVATWMTLNNSIRNNLGCLGLDRKAIEMPTLTPAELLEEAALEAEVVEEESGCAHKGACKGCAAALEDKSGVESGHNVADTAPAVAQEDVSPASPNECSDNVETPPAKEGGEA